MSPLSTPLYTTGLLPGPDVLADLHADTRSDSEGTPSPVERLLQTVEAHIAAEAETLPTYERLGRESGDPVVDLVMQMIVEDEVHHHGLLRRIGASLRDALYWSHSAEALPAAFQPTARTSPQAVADAGELIKEELDGARKLHQVAREQRKLSGGLVSVLIEAMAQDSEKHARLLQFVQTRLAEHSA